jgi:hypothetical protein
MRTPRKQPPIPPGLAIFGGEFAAKEFGVAGEMATSSREPPPPAPKPFTIPPPPWSVNYDPALDPENEPPQEATYTPNLDR